MPRCRHMLIAGIALIAVGLATLVFEERDLRRHRAWCAGAAFAEGAVSRIGQRNWHSRNRPTFDDNVQHVAVVQFRAANGVAYEFDAPDAPYQLNASVRVAYDPASPSTARLADRPRKPGCAGVLFAAGVALVGWALLH